MNAAHSVFRDANSHCCLRISVTDTHVNYVCLAETDGSIRVDLFTDTKKEFYNTYVKELADYPVARAAKHYLNPLTDAVQVTPSAVKALNAVLNQKGSTMNDVTATTTTEAAPAKKATKKAVVKTAAPLKVVTNVDGGKTVVKKEAEPAKKAVKKVPTKIEPPTEKAQRNVNATKQASIKNTGPTPAAAPVKTVGKVAKAVKGTYDKKESPTEANKDAQRVAIANHKKAKEIAVKKAAKAATKPAKKAAKPTAPKVVKKAATKVAPAKKAPAKKTKGDAPAKRGRVGAFEESMKITVLVKENPKRQGSAAYDIFELLKKSKTVGDFYAKGGGSHNLRYNVDHEYIKVGK